MNPCKRIEIVIEQPLVKRTARQLDELGAPGYTLIEPVSGRGDRGRRRADDPTESNCIFIVACEDEAIAEQIVDGIRPFLKKYGGICLVSDALWVMH